MIRRIVKMTFDPDKINMFLEVFGRVRDDISHFKGVKSLELLNDADHPNIFMTVSTWESAKDLENYRESDLFRSTWSQVKLLFADKPEAWSMVVI